MVATERRRAGRGEHADAGARRADPARWDEPRERGRRASARAPRRSNARAKRGGGERKAHRPPWPRRVAAPIAPGARRPTPVLGQQPTSASRRCARTQSEEIEISKKNDCDAGSVLHVSRGTLLLVDTSDDGKKGKQNKTPPFRTKKRAKIVLASTPSPRASRTDPRPPSPRHRRARRLPRSAPASRVRVARGLASSARCGYSRARRVPSVASSRASSSSSDVTFARRPRGPARPARAPRSPRPSSPRARASPWPSRSRRGAPRTDADPASRVDDDPGERADARDRRAAINNDANGAGRRFASSVVPAAAVPPRRPPRRLVRHAPDDRAAPERRARRDGTRARARIRRPEGRPRSRARG